MIEMGSVVIQDRLLEGDASKLRVTYSTLMEVATTRKTTAQIPTHIQTFSKLLAFDFQNFNNQPCKMF